MKIRTISGAALAVVACALGLTARAADADVFVIDENTAGTLYDGQIDGFPGLATFDGVADLAGNALGIALQDGVTEERGIIEMPLASIAAIDPGDVVSATLSFNIDDVIGTFGPGTSFDGTAAESIVLFDYAGDGVVDLGDYGNVVGAPLSIVDTTVHGTITDVSLSVSGPLVFDVDVTAAIVAHLTAAHTHMGVVMATQDDLTATSLDNLGDGGLGPLGVNGSFMPFLTIVTSTGEPPVYGKSEIKCQKSLGKEGGKYMKSVHKEVTKCMNAVLSAVSQGKELAGVASKCAAGADAGLATSKVATAADKAVAKMVASCTDVSPASIGNPCDALAASMGEVAECIVDAHKTRVEQALKASYSSACDLLGAVSLDGSYPTICSAD